MLMCNRGWKKIQFSSYGFRILHTKNRMWSAVAAFFTIWIRARRRCCSIKSYSCSQSKSHTRHWQINRHESPRFLSLNILLLSLLADMNIFPVACCAPNSLIMNDRNFIIIIYLCENFAILFRIVFFLAGVLLCYPLLCFCRIITFFEFFQHNFFCLIFFSLATLSAYMHLTNFHTNFCFALKLTMGFYFSENSSIIFQL